MTNESLLAIILIMAVIAALSLASKSTTGQTAGAFLQLTINHINIKGVITMINLTSTQQVIGQLKPQNRLGNEAPVEPGTVSVASSDDNVCEVVRDQDDETKFTIKAKNAGVAQINFAADADLGDGVATISGFTGVEVVPAGATGFGITFGEPEERPVPVV